MTQHTPGPWGIAMAEHTLDDTLSHIHVHQLVNGSAAGPLVAMATRFGAADGWTNARLIAAAPELLEALTEINDLSFALGGSSHTTTLDRIRTIIARTIAKATQGE